MKITDTTDFCWRVFFSPYITVSAHFPWCFRLCAFLLSSSSKNSTFFRCFAIIICVSLDVFLFRRIIDYICRCVYVLCAWENKRISSIQAECERVELRERAEGGCEKLYFGISLGMYTKPSLSSAKH